MDLLIKNGLVEQLEGKFPRYRTTCKGFEALGHFQEIEKLIPEMMTQGIESEA